MNNAFEMPSFSSRKADVTRRAAAVTGSSSRIPNSNSSQNIVVNTVAASIISAAVVAFSVPMPTNAMDDSYRISSCGVKEKNCVSSASVKNIKQFSSPWEYSVSDDEALARLKGLLGSMEGVAVDQVSAIEGKAVAGEDSEPAVMTTGQYLHATMKGDFLFEGEGNFEVLLKDKIVTFKASGYGASKSFVDGLRKKSDGVFTSSGGVADEYESGYVNEGVLGQLKAFYGYQSGEGFEDVFEEQ